MPPFVLRTLLAARASGLPPLRADTRPSPTAERQATDHFDLTWTLRRRSAPICAGLRSGLAIFSLKEGMSWLMSHRIQSCGSPWASWRRSICSSPATSDCSPAWRRVQQRSTFLAGQEGPDLRPMLRFWNHISYPGWLALEDAVRAGAGQAKFGQFSIEEQQIFSAGVEAFSMATAASLAANYDFSRHRRLLDIGGGTGSFLLAVLRRHAALRGTLFELPGACEAARQRLASEPERTRICLLYTSPSPRDS